VGHDPDGLIMTSEQALILRAAELARNAPQSWQHFVEAFRAYSSEQTVNLIQSPLDQLPVAQGRAQSSSRLLDHFANCLSSADKIESKRR
jgi:hypothetical protein